MGRLDMMIEHENGYERNPSFKRMAMIDPTIGRERPYEPNKEEKKKSPRRRSPSRKLEDDDHATEMYKDYDLYLAAKSGHLDDFKRILDRVSATASSSADVMWRLSPIGNTFLHVAANHGNQDLVAFMASTQPSFMLAKDFNGETALHLVAKGGDESMAKALVQIHRDLLTQNAGDEDNLLMVKNERGNTALHEALFNGRNSIAEYLIQEDPELSCLRNNNSQSVLYLAAKFGFVDCVSLILLLCTDEQRVNELFNKKSPIKAAIKRKHRGILILPIFCICYDGLLD